MPPAPQMPLPARTTATPRPLAEVMGAVLHELRTSGPLGLYVVELNERMGAGPRGEVRIDAALAAAITTLVTEGRAVLRGDLVTLSAAQREIDRLRADRDRGDVSYAAQLDVCVSQAEDAAAWRSLALELLERVVDSTPGEEERPHAYSPELARRLSAIARSDQPIEAASSDAREAYIAGIHDAAWMASYGRPSPHLNVVRVLIGHDGVAVRCVVLGTTSSGDWLLSAPATGRVWARANGAVLGARGEARIHPEDLAALRGEQAALASAEQEG